MLKNYNIISSCNSKLIPYVAVQLYSISKNSGRDVDFYLLHRDIPQAQLDMLAALSKELGNISFHSVVVPESEKYDILAKYGGGWAGEAYFPLCAHLLLPDDVKEALYIDAGDVIIARDISRYYNCGFEGKALIATAGRFKIRDNRLTVYTEDDLKEWGEDCQAICRGIFNSGSYMINLVKLRKAELTVDDFTAFAQMMRENISGGGIKKRRCLLWGSRADVRGFCR